VSNEVLIELYAGNHGPTK